MPIYRGLFTLIYSYGLRINEATALPIAAIDSDAMTLRVIGKGNKERILPLTEPVLQMLRESKLSAVSNHATQGVDDLTGTLLTRNWFDGKVCRQRHTQRDGIGDSASHSPASYLRLPIGSSRISARTIWTGGEPNDRILSW